MIEKSLLMIINLFKPQKDNSLPLSKFFRNFFELSRLKTVVGVGLLLMIFSLSMLNAPKPVLGGQEAVLTSPEPQEVQTQTTFNLPLTAGYISQNYHWFHKGVDITSPLGTTVYPITKGKVIEVTYGSLGYGHKVVIQHENGFESLYAHLGEIKVKVGDEISKDTVIGLVGLTGWSTGPHLHLETKKDGNYLDPLTVLPDFQLEKEASQ